MDKNYTSKVCMKDAQKLPLHLRTDVQQIQVARAWLGDAILSYHIRFRILNELGWNGEFYQAATCNKTLRRFGNDFYGLETPSEVEAHIYGLHEQDPEKAKQFCMAIYEYAYLEFYRGDTEEINALEKTLEQDEINRKRETRGY